VWPWGRTAGLSGDSLICAAIFRGVKERGKNACTTKGGLRLVWVMRAVLTMGIPEVTPLSAQVFRYRGTNTGLPRRFTSAATPTISGRPGRASTGIGHFPSEQRTLSPTSGFFSHSESEHRFASPPRSLNLGSVGLRSDRITRHSYNASTAKVPASKARIVS
jgi:hypothetical protein